MTSSAEKAALQQWQLQPLLNYLSVCVQGTSQNKRDVAVQCLEAILPRHEVRQAVWAIPGILSGFETSWSCRDARLSNLTLQISRYSQIEPESPNELSSRILLLVIDVRDGDCGADQYVNAPYSSWSLRLLRRLQEI